MTSPPSECIHFEKIWAWAGKGRACLVKQARGFASHENFRSPAQLLKHEMMGRCRTLEYSERNNQADQSVQPCRSCCYSDKLLPMHAK